MLSAIAAPPQLTGTGYVVGPDRADERLILDALVVDDPELLTFVPDIVAGPLPDLVQSLEEPMRSSYLDHRLGCIQQSVRRLQWFAACRR